MHAGTSNLDAQLEMVAEEMPQVIRGRIAGVTGLAVTAYDLPLPLGAVCRIQTRTKKWLEAEVVGFGDKQTVLMPSATPDGISHGDPVECITTIRRVPVGEQLLGRVLNAQSEFIDGGPPAIITDQYPLFRDQLSPMSRQRITNQLGTGIRSIDALLSCGQGQRLGIFSGPGIGKSVLLGMVARYTSADVVVIALVGERGREVREFIEKDLGPDGLRKSVMVVSTADDPPLLRVRAGFTATTIAEYFRDRGMNVLLLMDSVTRLATAQRQIGLAAGEPPASKGFTPSVFAMLPQLLERSGNAHGGTITGFYTVLVEGDELNDPVGDAVRGILDGHITLSRDLANRGHYPAISVLDSISRIMVDIVDKPQQQAARQVSQLLAVYKDIEDLVNIGAYVAGTNPEFDLAIRMKPLIDEFLQQRIDEPIVAELSRKELASLSVRIIQEAKSLAAQSQHPNIAANAAGAGN